MVHGGMNSQTQVYKKVKSIISLTSFVLCGIPFEKKDSYHIEHLAVNIVTIEVETAVNEQNKNIFPRPQSYFSFSVACVGVGTILRTGRAGKHISLCIAMAEPGIA